jgi:hypothetical protein
VEPRDEVLNFWRRRADIRSVEAAHPIWRPLGQLLVDKGLLSQEELEAVLAEQSSSGKRLGEIIVQRRLVSGPALTSALAEQWGIVLTTERGFGTGLRAEIEARHRAQRLREAGVAPVEADAEADAEITLDVVADVIDALAEAHAPERPYTPQLHVVSEPAQPDPPAEAEVVHLPAPAELHLLFVPTPDGYLLAEAAGPAPAVGTAMAAGVVSRLGPSPLPGDPRRCAYVLAE